MICKKCGNEVGDDLDFCPKCGYFLIRDKKKNIKSNMVGVNITAPLGKSNIILGIIAAIVVIVVFGVYQAKKSNNGDNENYIAQNISSQESSDEQMNDNSSDSEKTNNNTSTSSGKTNSNSNSNTSTNNNSNGSANNNNSNTVNDDNSNTDITSSNDNSNDDLNTNSNTNSNTGSSGEEYDYDFFHIAGYYNSYNSVPASSLSIYDSSVELCYSGDYPMYGYLVKVSGQKFEMYDNGGTYQGYLVFEGIPNVSMKVEWVGTDGTTWATYELSN